MRRLFFLVLIVIAGAGGYHLYHDPAARKMVQDAYDGITKYPAATSPNQAAEFFIKAINQRDYERAASYCSKSYGDQLVAVAASAKNLGDAIDGLKTKMGEYKITNATECRRALINLDPFPKDSLSIKVVSDTDPNALTAKAQFVMTQTDAAGDRDNAAAPQGYRVNPDYVNALWKDIPPAVSLKRVKDKEGDKYRWLFDFDAPPSLSKSVQTLNDPDRGGKLASQIRDLSHSINNEATVKEDFVKSFKEQVVEWAKR